MFIILIPILFAAISSEAFSYFESCFDRCFGKPSGEIPEQGFVLIKEAAPMGVAALKSLTDKGVSINAVDKDDNTALFYWVEQIDVNAVKSLVESGADVMGRNIRLSPASYIIARLSSPDMFPQTNIKDAEKIFELLLSSDSFTVPDPAETRILLGAVYLGNFTMVNALVKKYPDEIERTIDHCDGALRIALQSGYADIVKIFMEAKPDLIDKMFEFLRDPDIVDKKKRKEIYRGIGAWLIQNLDYCPDLTCWYLAPHCKANKKYKERRAALKEEGRRSQEKWEEWMIRGFGYCSKIDCWSNRLFCPAHQQE